MQSLGDMVLATRRENQLSAPSSSSEVKVREYQLWFPKGGAMTFYTMALSQMDLITTLDSKLHSA
jgi:hypothetical protein